MHGLDDALAGIGDGGVLLALLAALLLGLRHATDPDHLTAVSSLVLSDDPGESRRASTLGLLWGLGHATTLLAIGLPLVLLDRELPESVQRAAELTVGLVIVALALRLLVRWHHGSLRARPHEESYGVGLVHGIGGSAGVSILLVGSISGGAEAALALVVFAAASALSMAAVSGGFGYALSRGPASRALDRVVPLLATASLLFGAWYAAAALQAPA